jgi:hypothetical protein
MDGKNRAVKGIFWPFAVSRWPLASYENREFREIKEDISP